MTEHFDTRVGFGFDLHRLVEGRKLVLGGVPIAFEKGLLGHSDADVLLHAASDALLGAAGLGDIGQHFPDTDPALKNISSEVLVRKTFQMIRGRGFSVNNVDATILAEAPKLAPYYNAMRANLAELLKVEPGCVNIKATTMEGLGIIGRGEAMAAMCVVSLVVESES
jgi:2-C-methyl-D-erythritol 2,4-cyclodiphosphate synthase